MHCKKLIIHRQESYSAPAVKTMNQPVTSSVTGAPQGRAMAFLLGPCSHGIRHIANDNELATVPGQIMDMDELG